MQSTFAVCPAPGSDPAGAPRPSTPLARVPTYPPFPYFTKAYGALTGKTAQRSVLLYVYIFLPRNYDALTHCVIFPSI